MSDDEISNLSRAEVQELEEKTAEKNAWACCYDLALRVDGPHNTLNCYVSSKKEDYFFFNSEYLKQYQDKKHKEKTPGCNYFKKIQNCFRLQYERSENYTEYPKFSCADITNEACDFGKAHSWSGPELTRCPPPYPDSSKLPSYKYKSYQDAPLNTPDCQSRPPNDFQPRVNIRTAFNDGILTKDDPDTLSAFSDKFVVETKHVLSYLDHLMFLQSNQEKMREERIKQSAATKNKPCHGYNWKQLVTDGQLPKLKVVGLDKYIIHNNLDRDILIKIKEEKVLFIIEHLTRNPLSHCNNNQEMAHTNAETLANNVDPDNYDDDNDEKEEHVNSDSDSDVDETEVLEKLIENFLKMMKTGMKVTLMMTILKNMLFKLFYLVD